MNGRDANYVHVPPASLHSSAQLMMTQAPKFWRAVVSGGRLRHWLVVFSLATSLDGLKAPQLQRGVIRIHAVSWFWVNNQHCGIDAHFKGRSADI